MHIVNDVAYRVDESREIRAGDTGGNVSDALQPLLLAGNL